MTSDVDVSLIKMMLAALCTSPDRFDLPDLLPFDTVHAPTIIKRR
jgi:hypothetical protein